jgi:hypothetical protein
MDRKLGGLHGQYGRCPADNRTQTAQFVTRRNTVWAIPDLLNVTTLVYIYIYIYIYNSGLENREHRRRDPSSCPRDTLYPQKLALTSPTSGGRSAGIVRWRTQATEFSFF